VQATGSNLIYFNIKTMRNLECTVYISFWLKRFLTEYMITIRNQSNNTRNSYRDCYKQFLPYIAKQQKKSVDELLISDINVDNINCFLNYLEEEKECCIKTRNQRLTAINAFAYYVSSCAPEYLEWSRLVHTIPMKKENVNILEGFIIPTVSYLDRDEMRALLNAPDRKTEQGQKDYAMLLFLYNSGARVTEAASLTIDNLLYDNITCPQVRILGKGKKMRTCPLWERTVRVLKPFIEGRNTSEYVFLNRYGNPITRFGIYELIKRNVAKAILVAPSIAKKKVCPHTLRHTTGTHLYEAGTDINTIRAWLGHVSVNTTNIYTEVSMQMKEIAAKSWTIDVQENVTKKWKLNKGIMDFLNAL
jgi:integrase/recombinase XerD